jgi:hypothetical protein
MEWLTIKETCPLTQKPLHIHEIRKPGRIITNLLGELEMFCGNKIEGCKWQGEHNNYRSHLKCCGFKPRQELENEISNYKDKLYSSKLRESRHLEELRMFKLELKEKAVEVNYLVEEIGHYKSKVNELEAIVQTLMAKVRVYDKMHNLESKQDEKEDSALSQLARLRKLSNKINNDGGI